jgi:hypothetical protein
MLSKDTTTIRRAANYFIFNGWNVFDVKHDSANGADITIEKSGKTYRVEIKKALIGKRACNVKPVKGFGLKCDAIGILLPSGKVILQPMNEHLKLCAKSGVRGITELVRLNS